jgi:hypothetical protein
MADARAVWCGEGRAGADTRRRRHEMSDDVERTEDEAEVEAHKRLGHDPEPKDVGEDSEETDVEAHKRL